MNQNSNGAGSSSNSNNNNNNRNVFGSTPILQTEFEHLHNVLKQDLKKEEISERQGPGGGTVHYLETWRAIKLANSTFGFNGWSSSILEMTSDYVETNQQTGKFSAGVSSIVRITLKDGSYHDDIGYGNSDNQKHKGAAIEQAKKKAVSDALKRALKNFGSALGLTVYDKDHITEIKKQSKKSAFGKKTDDAPGQETVPYAIKQLMMATAPTTTAAVTSNGSSNSNGIGNGNANHNTSTSNFPAAAPSVSNPAPINTALTTNNSTTTSTTIPSSSNAPATPSPPNGLSSSPQQNQPQQPVNRPSAPPQQNQPSRAPTPNQNPQNARTVQASPPQPNNQIRNGTTPPPPQQQQPQQGFPNNNNNNNNSNRPVMGRGAPIQNGNPVQRQPNGAPLPPQSPQQQLQQQQQRKPPTPQAQMGQQMPRVQPTMNPQQPQQQQQQMAPFDSNLQKRSHEEIKQEKQTDDYSNAYLDEGLDENTDFSVDDPSKKQRFD